MLNFRRRLQGFGRGGTEKGALLGLAVKLTRQAATHQVAQRVHRRVGDAVIDAGAPALAGDEAVLGHQ